MTRQRRSFSVEFKTEAASLVVDQGYSMTEAGYAVDVGESTLRRWVNQLRAERDGITPTTKALTPEQQRIQELEARSTAMSPARVRSVRVPVSWGSFRARWGPKASLSEARAIRNRSVHAVMAAQSDFVEVVHTLKQVVCVKG